MRKTKAKGDEMVTLIVGSKAYNCTRKMALATIELAKQKYLKEDVNAIVAVEKDGIISLQKDVYTNRFEMVNEVSVWNKGGYQVHYTVKKG